MTDTHRKLVDEVVKSVKLRAFSTAATDADQVLRSANEVSHEELLEVATALVDTSAMYVAFNHVRDINDPDFVAKHIVMTLTQFLGQDHFLIARARTNLAHSYSMMQNTPLAEAEWKWVLDRRMRELPDHDPSVQTARSNLAVQYRNSGRLQLAQALYADLDVCEHLQSAETAILAAGGKVDYVGTPWSRNCRMWMYLSGVVIDAEALKAMLELPSIVSVHSHRGTHDGHEQGLVCDEHHDAVMGRIRRWRMNRFLL